MTRSSWSDVVRSGEVRTALERSGRVRRIEHRVEVGSTQDVAHALDDGPGVLVIADRQRGGRGRHGRTWQDGPRTGASLAASLVIEDRPQELGVVPLALGLAVLDAVRDALGAAPVATTLALRWPNDLVVGDAPGRKCAGVLVERRVAPPGALGGPDAPVRLVIGIGIDVDWRHDARDASARAWTSLAEAADADVDRGRLLAGLLTGLDVRLDAQAPDVLAAHRSSSASLGREVVVTAPDGTRVTGRAVDLAPDGALVLEVGGTRREVRAGFLDEVDGPERVATDAGSSAHG